ncbi:transmembrane protein [Cyclospora cayetanensis]|uniref:Transmembrane protein n=1 Tax=Cyclospora cayetanensis TaxID=88456 RepID=A0A1D3D0A4_9EIME|nr:transmembrane protein [Cyclospora cayetanensis]
MRSRQHAYLRAPLCRALFTERGAGVATNALNELSTQQASGERCTEERVDSQGVRRPCFPFDQPLDEALSVYRQLRGRSDLPINAPRRRMHAAWLRLWTSSGSRGGTRKGADAKGRKQALPHLLAFIGKGCPYCERMERPLRLVEEQTGERILRLEVWHNQLNYESAALWLSSAAAASRSWALWRTPFLRKSPLKRLHLRSYFAKEPPAVGSQPSVQGPVARLFRRIERLRRESQERVAKQFRKELRHVLRDADTTPS